MATVDPYRTALETIVRIATSPDTHAVGALPGGGVGGLWSTQGKDRALDEIVRVAKVALSQSKQVDESDVQP